jgi:ABC-type phosphate/phosphonate transport system substrate-binding protein
MSIANARMYSVTPAAAQAWKDLFAWASDRSGVTLQVIDHAFPAPLAELWARPDLGCTFMCGWPFAREGMIRPIVAAPIPIGTPDDRPLYRTHFMVRADSAFERLEDTFGRRLIYTVEDSHSGYNAPRHHLEAFRTADRSSLYAELIGPAVTPRRVVQSLLDGVAEVGPLDSYAHDLLKRHVPALMAGLRILASTDFAPIPPLVASLGADSGETRALGDALLASSHDQGVAPILEALQLKGFARPATHDYAVTLEWADAAARAGYERLA